MADIIKKAQKANKSAMIELYQANKENVYYISKLLMCDEKAAENICINAFKGVWDQLIGGRISSEDEFSALVIKKAVNLSKNKITMSNNKAFKIPQAQNFAITQYANEQLVADGGATKLILQNLPALHRFIYVLNAYAKWSNAEISELLHTKPDIVKLALDAEIANVERLSIAISRSLENDFDITAEQFHILMNEEKDLARVIDDVDNAVISSIDEIVEPLKKETKKHTRKTTLITVAVVLVLAFVLSMAAILIIDVNGESSYYAVIDIADYGCIDVKLDGNAAPRTVENFVNLAKDGFYNGLTFHRIIEGFMMQGGDPKGNGTGGNTDENGNEINIKGEFASNGYDNYISHVRGTISMARSNDPDSGSSQFFIVQEDALHLDGDYAAFGSVVSGMDVVDAVCGAAEPTDDNGTIEPEAQPVINSITIYTPKEYEALS